MFRKLARFVVALCVSVGATGIGAALSQSPASAAGDCTSSSFCRWTEDDNGNWPLGSTNPACSPCEFWGPDPTGNIAYLPYQNGLSNTADIGYANAADFAMHTWSSLPYYAPTFYKANSGYVFYGATPMAQNADGSWPCGQESDSYSIQHGQAFIVSATVNLNATSSSSFPGYSDGPSNNGSCDVRNVELHETGHVFGLGHSSVKTDLMYFKVNNDEAVSQDEQNAMAAIYGTYDAGCSSDYCGGHADVSLPPSPIVVHPLSAAELEQTTLRKAQAAEQAVLSTEADANSIANSAKQQVTKPTICTTSCDPPPGYSAPRPTPIVPS